MFFSFDYGRHPSLIQQSKTNFTSAFIFIYFYLFFNIGKYLKTFESLVPFHKIIILHYRFESRKVIGEKMLASLINKLMKSAITLQHDSWHDCLNDHLVHDVNEFSDLALLVYAALRIIYDMLIIFCSRKGCSDLFCPSSVSLPSARKSLKSLERTGCQPKGQTELNCGEKHSKPN